MSDTGQPRPGRISGEDLPFVTGRGEPQKPNGHHRDGGFDTKTAVCVDCGTSGTNREEEVDASSTLGLVQYKREPYHLEPEERLRHGMAFGLLGLLGLVLLTGLIGIIVVTMTGGDAGSLTRFCSDILGKLFPMLTLVVGYIFGRQSKTKAATKKKGK
jgi:hypothetical protein